jgi:hypothetical protein
MLQAWLDGEVVHGKREFIIDVNNAQSCANSSQAHGSG